jgi:hypothetical protein
MSEDCPHCVFEKTESNCRGCFEGSHYKPKPVTNADRIRSMTDEELADYLRYYSDSYARYDMDWLDWLKQEAKDG